MTSSLITPSAQGGMRIYVISLMLYARSASIKLNIDFWYEQHLRRNTWNRCKPRLKGSWPSRASQNLFGNCCQRLSLPFLSVYRWPSLLTTSGCWAFPYTMGRRILLPMSKPAGHGWISLRLMRQPYVTHFPLLCLGQARHGLGDCARGRFQASSNSSNNSLLSSWALDHWIMGVTI